MVSFSSGFAGIPIQSDLQIITGAGHHSRTPGFSVVKEEVLHILQALGLPVQMQAVQAPLEAMVEPIEANAGKHALSKQSLQVMKAQQHAVELNAAEGKPAEHVLSDVSTAAGIKGWASNAGSTLGVPLKRRDDTAALHIRAGSAKSKPSSTKDFELVVRMPMPNAGRLVIRRQALQEWVSRPRAA